MRAALHADSIADFSPLYKGIRKAQQSSSAKKKSSAARHGMRQFEARFVSKARGRTFRRRSRRNPAGYPPRRRAARHAVRPRLPLPRKFVPSGTIRQTVPVFSQRKSNRSIQRHGLPAKCPQRLFRRPLRQYSLLPWMPVYFPRHDKSRGSATPPARFSSSPV